MSLRVALITGLFIAALSAGLAADAVLPGFTVEFVLDGAVVKFDRPTQVQRITVYECDDNGTLLRPLFTEQLPDRPVVHHRLFFAFEGRKFGFEVVERDGMKHYLAEWGNSAGDGLVLQVPYTGEADVTERWGRRPENRTVLATPGSELTAEVEVTFTRMPGKAALVLLFPQGGIKPRGEKPGWSWETDHGRTEFRRNPELAAPGEIARLQVPLRVVGKPGEEVKVQAFFCDNQQPLQRDTTIRIVSPQDLTQSVRAGNVLLPTDARGMLDIRKPRDTVVLPSGAGLTLRRLVGSERYFDYYAPFAHETVCIENRGKERLPVAVSMRVTREDNSPEPGFRAPDYLAGPEGILTTTATLEPGRMTPVVLPIYVRPEILLPGRYKTIVEARILGTDMVASRVEHDFQVRSADLRALIVTLASVVVSVAGLAVFLIMQRRIFKSFRVSEMVLIALFATMTFTLAVFPGSLLGPVFNAVAGPFGFLLQGVFFEGLRFLVTVTLLVLVPRVGTVTLVSLVRYLIGGIALGGFSPVDLFYFGTSVALMEGALFAAGITTKHGVLSRREIGAAAFLRVALVMGLANAATQYSIYCLNITFYRLYFAEWFIWLAVCTSGFLYAALGTLSGLKLGLRLRRISE